MSRRLIPLLIGIAGLALALIPRPTLATYGVCCAIPVSAKPFAVATNPLTHKTYVAHEIAMPSTSLVTVIDDTTNSVIKDISVGQNSSNSSVAINAQTNRIYSTNYEGSSVSVIDGSCDCVVDTIAVATATGGGPRAVAVDPSTNRFYVGTGPSHGVFAFDGAGDTLICSADMGVGGDVQGVQVNPTNHLVFVSRKGAFPYDRYSLMSGSNCGLLFDNVPLSCTGASNQVVYNPSDNHFYAIGYNFGNVAAYNGATGAEDSCLGIPGSGGGGFGSGIDVPDQVLYVVATPSASTPSLYRIPLPFNPATVTLLTPGLGQLTEVGIDRIGCSTFAYVPAGGVANEVWVAQDAGAGPASDPDCNNDTDFSNPGSGLPCVQDHGEDVNHDGYSDADELTPLGPQSCTGLFPSTGGLGHASVNVACPGRLYATNGGTAAQDLGARKARADVNLTGKVDLADLIIMAGQYNQPVTGSTDMRADLDLNASGKVDLADLIIAAGVYNQTVPPC